MRFPDQPALCSAAIVFPSFTCVDPQIPATVAGSGPSTSLGAPLSHAEGGCEGVVDRGPLGSRRSLPMPSPMVPNVAQPRCLGYIATLDLRLQAQLLRMVEDRCFRRVAGESTFPFAHCPAHTGDPLSAQAAAAPDGGSLAVPAELRVQEQRPRTHGADGGGWNRRRGGRNRYGAAERLERAVMRDGVVDAARPCGNRTRTVTLLEYDETPTPLYACTRETTMGSGLESVVFARSGPAADRPGSFAVSRRPVAAGPCLASAGQ